jgi:transposase-like protein
LEFWARGGNFPQMKKSDVTCPECRAGYRRMELVSRPGSKAEYRCLLCNHLLETFDGSTEVALRLTVPARKKLKDGDNLFPN